MRLPESVSYTHLQAYRAHGLHAPEVHAGRRQAAGRGTARAARRATPDFHGGECRPGARTCYQRVKGKVI